MTNFFVAPKKNRHWATDHLFMLAFLLGINLVMSIVVRQIGFFVINKDIFYFSVDLWVIVIIVLAINWFCLYFKLIHNYPVPCVLIISGAWSNLIERIIFGGVADYINVYFALSNLADLQIWLGLLGLNLLVWFPKSNDRISTYLGKFKKN